MNTNQIVTCGNDLSIEPAREAGDDSGWRAITESVDSQPAEDVPVWLYLPDIGQPIIGCRVYDEGWLWARCYGGFYYDKDAREWKTDDAEEDNLAPTHWMSLPVPPIAAHQTPPEL